MNVIVLYLVLLKATMTSFSGLASLPMLRNDLVVQHRVLTDRELNTAVAVGSIGPGPLGLYVVSVGYFVAGVPGALAGMLALMTPAFLILPMVRYLGRRADHPRAKRVIQSVTLAAAGLILSASVPLARDAITGVLPALLAVAVFGLMVATRIDAIWVIVGSAGAGLLWHVFR
jgi:chromate transporter